MQRRWTAIVGGVAIAIAAITATEEAESVQPSSRAIDTETTVVPPEELGEGDPGLSIRDSPELEGEATDSETFEADPAITPLAAEPPPTVEYDVSKLPPPVRRIREQIIEAAATGDVEQLRPIFEANGQPPLLGFGEVGDPVEQLKSLAGDDEGREMLAILIEVLEAGYVHVDVDTPEEMYVWPYFARYPMEKLTGPQMVELFKLLTAGDYEDMKIYGTYLFYRAGIAPNGVWKYFVAGD